eukprot:343807-Amorphochlora_amoeboformis.AAC.1
MGYDRTHSPWRPAPRKGNAFHDYVDSHATPEGGREPRVRVEATKRGKGGKVVTLIRGLEKLSQGEAKALLKKLK